ncbi:hypothetical protein LCGC14_3112470 [marine sediment metagenome]|uniref:Uncharacterized protein n=1 Tax=marine sediment metagenome TaxID=412755 RepID=A0A0F8YUL1_9ZZZZ
MPNREVVLKKQVAEAKDPELENNDFHRLQTQCNLLTKEVMYLLKQVRELS